MNSGNIIKILAIGIIISISGISLRGQVNDLKNTNMKKIDTKEFPALPYGYDALEPYIDARTMEIHYDKHHRAYFNNFTNAIKGKPLESKTIGEIFARVSEAGDAVRNNGGGFYNHVFFWNNLSAKSAGASPELLAALTNTFGSFDKFKEVFSNSAITRFGS